jgi:hypothetical protein
MCRNKKIQYGPLGAHFWEKNRVPDIKKGVEGVQKEERRGQKAGRMGHAPHLYSGSKMNWNRDHAPTYIVAVKYQDSTIGDAITEILEARIL